MSILRRVTIPQVIRGQFIPKGTFIAVSPLVVARDSKLFPNADRYLPARWLTGSGDLDEAQIRKVQWSGMSTQFGKGQHACAGERLTRILVLDLYWGKILEDETHAGYDVEFLSGVKQGGGVDNIGVEPEWAGNLGLPLPKEPVMVRFRKLARH